MKKLLEASHAIAEAVKAVRPDVIAAYPITPQTQTRLAVIIDVVKIRIFFVCSAFMPKCIASSSPMLIAFKSWANK